MPTKLPMLSTVNTTLLLNDFKYSLCKRYTDFIDVLEDIAIIIKTTTNDTHTQFRLR